MIFQSRSGFGAINAFLESNNIFESEIESEAEDWIDIDSRMWA